MTTATPQVPVPAGANFVDNWDTDGTAMPYRFVNFAAGTVTDHEVNVSTYAFQLADGSLASAGDEATGILRVSGLSAASAATCEQSARTISRAMMTTEVVSATTIREAGASPARSNAPNAVPRPATPC